MDIFINFSFSSKTKLCCFCQILCQISTLLPTHINEILQTAGRTVSRITVVFFLCMYILDFYLNNLSISFKMFHFVKFRVWMHILYQGMFPCH